MRGPRGEWDFVSGFQVWQHPSERDVGGCCSERLTRWKTILFPWGPPGRWCTRRWAVGCGLGPPL